MALNTPDDNLINFNNYIARLIFASLKEDLYSIREGNYIVHLLFLIADIKKGFLCIYKEVY